MIAITRDELERLKGRAGKCAMDKSYLQLVIRRMNRLFVGRELRMVELKEKLGELTEKLVHCNI